MSINSFIYVYTPVLSNVYLCQSTNSSMCIPQYYLTFICVNQLIHLCVYPSILFVSNNVYYCVYNIKRNSSMCIPQYYLTFICVNQLIHLCVYPVLSNVYLCQSTHSSMCIPQYYLTFICVNQLIHLCVYPSII